MSMVFILVILSLMLAGFAVWAFFWAVKNNQFDDLDTPAYSILDDEDEKKEEQEKRKVINGFTHTLFNRSFLQHPLSCYVWRSLRSLLQKRYKNSIRTFNKFRQNHNLFHFRNVGCRNYSGTGFKDKNCRNRLLDSIGSGIGFNLPWHQNHAKKVRLAQLH